MKIEKSVYRYRRANTIAEQNNDNRIVIDIDLSTGKVEIKPLPKELKFKGGRYLTFTSIFGETDPNAHPLGAENNFYIGPGLLSATPCPNSGGCSIGARSPLTGGINETNVGGTLATYLAKMKVALIKIRGRSEKENGYLY